MEGKKTQVDQYRDQKFKIKRVMKQMTTETEAMRLALAGVREMHFDIAFAYKELENLRTSNPVYSTFIEE